MLYGPIVNILGAKTSKFWTLHDLDLFLQFSSNLYETQGIVTAHQWETFVWNEILNLGLKFCYGPIVKIYDYAVVSIQC